MYTSLGARGKWPGLRRCYIVAVGKLDVGGGQYFRVFLLFLLTEAAIICVIMCGWHARYSTTVCLGLVLTGSPGMPTISSYIAAES